jgi:DNA-binding NarL/FixJ family response regulator
MVGDRETRILLASNRSAIRAFFPSSHEQPGGRFTVHQVPIPSPSSPELADGIQLAQLAVLDVAPDPVGAMELCHSLKSQKPALPIAALVCCTEHIAPWHLSALIDAGVTSLLDLQASADSLAAAFHGIANGDIVLHLHAAPGGAALLRNVTSKNRGDGTVADLSPTDLDIQLLRLVANGLSDNDIGMRLHMSPFTVRHHIERLRREVIARNRVELAAWAGRNGFYQPSESESDSDAGNDHALSDIRQRSGWG